MSTVPSDDDRIGEINEAFTNCDQCQGLFWWDEMLTDDGGWKWFCSNCYGGDR